MKNWRWLLSLGCLILGILMAIQFKGQYQEGFPLATYRPAELMRLVKDTEAERTALQEEVRNLRGRMAEYETSRGGGGDVAHVLSKDLQRARLEAGLVPVEGPGVEVVLQDSQRKPQSGEDDYFYLVHDVDLNQLVSELWSLGAEAVAVNDQRLVVNSSIRCVGPVVLVNTVRLSPPYRVEAIGDPGTLSTGLNMRGGFLDAMAISRAHGVMVAIHEKPRIKIPAFNGVIRFHYANTVVK